MMVRFVRRKGNAFIAVRANRRGAYAVATRRIKRVGTIKVTVGTKGRTLSVKRKIGRMKCELGYDFSTHAPYLNARGTRRGRPR